MSHAPRRSSRAALAPRRRNSRTVQKLQSEGAAARAVPHHDRWVVAVRLLRVGVRVVQEERHVVLPEGLRGAVGEELVCESLGGASRGEEERGARGPVGRGGGRRRRVAQSPSRLPGGGRLGKGAEWRWLSLLPLLAPPPPSRRQGLRAVACARQKRGNHAPLPFTSVQRTIQASQDSWPGPG